MPLQPGEIALMENTNPQFGNGEFHVIEVTPRAIYAIPAYPTNEVFIRTFRSDQGWNVARHGINVNLTNAMMLRLHNYKPNQHTPEGYIDQINYLLFRITESIRSNEQWEPYIEKSAPAEPIGTIGEQVLGTHQCEKGKTKRVPIPPGRQYLDVRIEDDDDGENFVFAFA